MQPWRETERPRGMQDYQRWFRPEGMPKAFGLSDIDGLIHCRTGVHSGAGRFLMVEFKPELDALTTGQRITLEHFTRLPGCTGIVIADGKWSDRTGQRIEDDEETLIQVWVGGEYRIYSCTVQRLNEGLSAWYSGFGWLVKHPEPEIPEVLYMDRASYLKSLMPE